MSHVIQLFKIVLLTSLITACGYHLRGSTDGFTLKSALVTGQTQMTDALKKSLVQNKVVLVNNASQAEMQVELTKENFEKRILSLGGTGKVTEYELYYRVYFRTKTNGNQLWSELQTLESRRFFSYSDASLLAKQIEERQLNESMQKDVLNNLVRRLSKLK